MRQSFCACRFNQLLHTNPSFSKHEFICSVFLDDNMRNIHAAREIGWRSILVGRIGRDCGKPVTSEHAEAEIDRIHDIRTVLPEIFVEDCQ